MKRIEVVAGVIKFKNKILCVQRGESKLQYISKKYEFPGGKIEEGETKENALIREIQEELNMKISISKEFMTVEHQYQDFYLVMHTFLCDVKTEELTLNEHLSYEWLCLSELNKLDWAAADVPIVNKLVRNG